MNLICLCRVSNLSGYPLQKINVIRTLLNRAKEVSADESLPMEIGHVIEVLRPNGYIQEDIIRAARKNGKEKQANRETIGFAPLRYIRRRTSPPDSAVASVVNSAWECRGAEVKIKRARMRKNTSQLSSRERSLPKRIQK